MQPGNTTLSPVKNGAIQLNTSEMKRLINKIQFQINLKRNHRF